MRHGFGLIEVLVAMLLIGTVTAAALGALSSGYAAAARAGSAMEAAALADLKMAELRELKVAELEQLSRENGWHRFAPPYAQARWHFHFSPYQALEDLYQATVIVTTDAAERRLDALVYETHTPPAVP